MAWRCAARRVECALGRVAPSSRGVLTIERSCGHARAARAHRYGPAWSAPHAAWPSTGASANIGLASICVGRVSAYRRRLQKSAESPTRYSGRLERNAPHALENCRSAMTKSAISAEKGEHCAGDLCDRRGEHCARYVERSRGHFKLSGWREEYRALERELAALPLLAEIKANDGSIVLREVRLLERNGACDEGQYVDHEPESMRVGFLSAKGLEQNASSRVHCSDAEAKWRETPSNHAGSGASRCGECFAVDDARSSSSCARFHRCGAHSRCCERYFASAGRHLDSCGALIMDGRV